MTRATRHTLSALATAAMTAASTFTAIGFPSYGGDNIVRFTTSCAALFLAILGSSSIRARINVPVTAPLYFLGFAAMAWAIGAGGANQAPQAMGVVFVVAGTLAFMMEAGTEIKRHRDRERALGAWATNGDVLVGTAIEPIRAGEAVAMKIVDGNTYLFPANKAPEDAIG